MNGNEKSGRTALIDEARALLSMIDAAQAAEDIDPDTASRKTGLTMQRLATQLVAEFIAQLRPATAVPKTENNGGFVGRLIWI